MNAVTPALPTFSPPQVADGENDLKACRIPENIQLNG
jgi:hypothetical protein